MDDKGKRMLMFVFGCLAVRAGAAVLANRIDEDKLPIMGAVALLPAIGFFTIYLFDLRKTGRETFGEKIWWNELRAIHGALYLTFATMAFKKSPNAWVPLAIDVALGAMAFSVHHWNN